MGEAIIDGTNLGSKIEAKEAVLATGQGVFDQERDFVGKADLDLRRQASGFGETNEVLEGEAEGDGIGEINLDVHFWPVDIGMLAQGDGAIANIATSGELDPLLRAFDSNSLMVSAWSEWRLGTSYLIPRCFAGLGISSGTQLKAS